MFQDNPYVIVLFDTLRGGPPRAFECITCGKLCKEEKVILAHLKNKHQVEVQQCLFLTDNSEGIPRKLRAGKPSLLPENSKILEFPPKDSLTPSTEQVAEVPQKLLPLTQCGTNEKELPSCMSPEFCGFQTSPESSCSADVTNTSTPTKSTSENEENISPGKDGNDDDRMRP